MVSAQDVAVYILQGKQMSAMKLQKLTYYSQAWSLTWDNKPLFPERIEAWVHGPVVPDLYQHHQGKYLVDGSVFPDGDASTLSDEQTETIDSVLSSYGEMSAGQLSELTHAEEPWKQARKDLGEADHGQFPISHESMQSFYTELSESELGVQSIEEVGFSTWTE